MSAFERITRRERVTTETVWRGTDPTPTVETRTTTTTRYRVTGVAAVTRYAETERGRLYLPTTVIVEHPGVPHGVSVTVLGSLQRKDGSLSENTTTLYRYSWRRTEWPAWLVEIVEDAKS